MKIFSAIITLMTACTPVGNYTPKKHQLQGALPTNPPSSVALLHLWKTKQNTLEYGLCAGIKSGAYTMDDILRASLVAKSEAEIVGMLSAWKPDMVICEGPMQVGGQTKENHIEQPSEQLITRLEAACKKFSIRFVQMR